MEKQIFLQDSPSFVDLCTLHQHAMRYYRLWIYACNTVLALATLVFTVFAVSVLVDPRITLLSGVELYQPTFLYAYVALLLQCGVLQAIGCLGALRLNQKLLNTYWTLLLVLMIGDIIVGLVWAFRLDRIKSTLKPNLRIRLSADYGTDPDFTQVWDWLQSHEMCCGVDKATDFHHPNESTSLNNHYDVNGLPYETTASPLPKLPSTCCTFSVTNQLPVPTASSGSQHSKGSSESKRSQRHNQIPSSSSHNNLNSNANTFYNSENPKNNIDILNLNAVQEQGSGSGGGRVLSGSIVYQRRQKQGRQNSQYRSTSAPLKRSQRHIQIPSSSHNNLNRNANTYYNSENPSNIIDILNLNTVQGQGSGSGSGGGRVSSGSMAYQRRQNKGGRINSKTYPSTSAPQQTTTESSALPYTFGTCAIPAHLATNSIVSPTPPSYYSDLGGSGSGSGSSSSEESSSSLLINSDEMTPTPSINVRTQSSWPSGSSPWPPVSSTTSSPVIVTVKPHRVGCGEKVLEWLDHVTDVLFVIGFCIIVFLKGCFLTILRYEIKEMIQKIRMMNGEDPTHTAAMNELIGLTSLYENGDGGEGEELMASSAPGDNTSNTNLDDLESDKFLRKSEGHRGSCGSGGLHSRGSADAEDLIGNNVNAAAKRSYYGNHIGPSANNTSAPAIVSTKQEIEEDFDSSSALLGRYDSAGRKFRDQNGGRALPRNGNNNSASTTIPSSTSAPFPIETVATVNSSAC